MLYTTLLSVLFRAIYGDAPESDDAPEEGRGLILMADGVGGLDLCGMALKHMVAKSGARHAVRVFTWGHGPLRWHADLTSVAHHEAKAAVLLGEVSRWLEERPGSPVFLVGKSGGTGLIIRALEQLPEESVEAVVLLAPALSPTYDLSRALRAVRREAVVFYSPLDVIVLGVGTLLFGTIDRIRSVGAGMVGFRRPPVADGDADDYRKLRQVRWSPSMATTGYLGGHVGPDLPAFLRKYVVPILTRPIPRTDPGATTGPSVNAGTGGG